MARTCSTFIPNGVSHCRFVQHLQSAQLDRVSRVCISTIQRLYSMLRGEEIDAEIDERSGYELRESLWKQPPPVIYNPCVPIETFDFIITDECHRSIYNLWRQVLEYFDAFLIGITAMPRSRPSVHILLTAVPAGVLTLDSDISHPYDHRTQCGAFKNSEELP
jgi:type I site-specific restriction endonuclease